MEDGTQGWKFNSSVKYNGRYYQEVQKYTLKFAWNLAEKGWKQEWKVSLMIWYNRRTICFNLLFVNYNFTSVLK